MICREQLGARITEYLFWQARASGSVHGVVLDDGRRVVVEAQQPDKSLAVLREVVRTDMHWLCGPSMPLFGVGGASAARAGARDD